MRRQKAREIAFLLLYRMDMGGLSLEEATEFVEKKPDQDIWDFALSLARGTWENLESIDDLISRHSEGWELDRMVSTDRNILRLAVYELFHGKNAPPAVVTDQALKLAQKFSTPASSKFINGILGAILREKSGEVAKSDN
ncbi:MAG: transcription antitermination factor NusB [Caldiserica bacterium]|nr:transcription antitermination factor NusB [Caldisericota bacterium]